MDHSEPGSGLFVFKPFGWRGNVRAVEESPGAEEEGGQLKVGMRQETLLQKFGLRLDTSIRGHFSDRPVESRQEAKGPTCL